MGSQGEVFNIALTPQGAKQLLDPETLAPNHLELRNGVRTDAGFWKGRPGYATEWILGVAQPIPLLIPFRRTATSGLGFAVTSTGAIYELLSAQAKQLYSGETVDGTFRPTWDVFDGIPIICSGQAIVKIRVDEAAGNNNVELLGGSPPAARFISVIQDRVIVSGQNDTQFNWSDAGNSEIWPAINFSNVTGHGERIRYQYTKGTDLYFFKDFNIEVWGHIGGDEVFGRSGIIPILDKHRAERGLQGFSVVLAGDPARFFFYADGDFWALDGAVPQRISLNYKREVGNIPNVDGIYGYDFAKEHVIRWFEPVSGRCFVFDYRNNNFTEDNAWANGAWQRLPIYSYMEMQDKAFVGDYDPTGIVSEWDDDIATDNGLPIRVYRKLRFLLDPKKNHKARWNRLLCRLERGQGAIGTDPTLQIRWALDGAALDINQSVSLGEAELGVGTSGNYDPYLELTNLGVGREALLELTQYASVRHLLTHLTVTAKPLGR
jgi:hypothetical protein